MQAVLTDYDHINDHQQPASVTAEQALAHLFEKTDNAVVIVGQVYRVAVWCGAGGSLNSYYHQELPLEDPNDAEGGDLDAEQAMLAAMDHALDRWENS